MRIISGELRGRKLGPAAPGVRPTSDRVRESVFSRLGDVLRGARVLDLFAGTGALGIEAISRGAESLVSVDRSAPVIRALTDNVARFELEARVRIVRTDARAAIQKLADEAHRFDVVFVDPPYDDYMELGPLLRSLIDAHLIAPAGVVVVESAKRHAVPPIPGLTVEQTRSYGDTSITWLIPSDGPDDGEARARS